VAQERYPAAAFAKLLQQASAGEGAHKRRRKAARGGLRLSAKDAAALGIKIAAPALPQQASKRTGWDPFDPQERLAQALRERLGVDQVRTEVVNLIPGRRYRADIVIDSARLVIEFDGFAYHRSKQAFQKDRERQNAFTAAGWSTLRFFHAQVRNQLDAVVAQVEQFVSARQR
jgi:very-short-patch-repair endonuclease